MLGMYLQTRLVGVCWVQDKVMHPMLRFSSCFDLVPRPMAKGGVQPLKLASLSRAHLSILCGAYLCTSCLQDSSCPSRIASFTSILRFLFLASTPWPCATSGLNLRTSSKPDSLSIFRLLGHKRTSKQTKKNKQKTKQNKKTTRKPQTHTQKTTEKGHHSPLPASQHRPGDVVRIFACRCKSLGCARSLERSLGRYFPRPPE